MPIHHGDLFDVLPTLEADSLDACVTDPPYDLTNRTVDVKGCVDCGRTLGGRDGKPVVCPACGGYLSRQRSVQRKGFMGKKWDGQGVAFKPETWQAVYRVLKPGAHLCAFGGTRTFHRMTCAIEDAGFEIRDCLSWLYGSGFPKSLDVGKAIDHQRHDRKEWITVGVWLKRQRERSGMTAKDLCGAIGAHGAVNHGGAVANWEAGFSCPTWEQWTAMQTVLAFGSEMDAEVWRLNGRKGTVGNVRCDREVTAPGVNTIYRPIQRVINAGTPVVDMAKQWDGWGTALKPSWEPVILARKPLQGTVAANVQRHGTGAINIDVCRIDYSSPDDLARTMAGVEAMSRTERDKKQSDGWARPWQQEKPRKNEERVNAAGRWPANVLLDEEAAALLDEMTGDLGVSRGGEPFSGEVNRHGIYGSRSRERTGSGVGFNDSGGASRFYYVAKPSREERNYGTDILPQRDERNYSGGALNRPEHVGSDGVQRTGYRNPRGNGHPTVKPIEVIRWLVKLITPLPGTVLDPFMGSGTTGMACRYEQRGFIGIEREAEYFAIAESRIAAVAPLFGDAEL